MKSRAGATLEYRPLERTSAPAEAWPPDSEAVRRFKRDVAVVCGACGVDPTRLTWTRTAGWLQLLPAGRHELLGVQLEVLHTWAANGAAGRLATALGTRAAALLRGVVVV